MTQDSSLCDEDNKNCIDILDLNCENSDGCSSLKEKRGLNDGESQTETPTVDHKFDSQVNFNRVGDKVKTESEERSDRLDFAGDNAGDFDPMKNLRMSIRKKRLSNSSAVSNEYALEEKRSFRKFKKRRKRRWELSVDWLLICVL